MKSNCRHLVRTQKDIKEFELYFLHQELQKQKESRFLISDNEANYNIMN